MSNASVLGSRGSIPESLIRFYPDLSEPGEIAMLVCDRLRSGLAKQLPNLQLIQKMGAGVETMVNDPGLSDHVRITRVNSDSVAMEMAQYCLTYVLNDVFHIDYYKTQQKQNNWSPKEPLVPENLTVCVLGLGKIGGFTAELFKSFGFNVLGWSRTQKQIKGIDCISGRDGLDQILPGSDYVVSILPSTTETTHLFDQHRLSIMKSGSMLINVGRGTLIDELALVEAIKQGRPSRIVMDVFEKEPLSCDSPLWNLEGVTITPHVSGWHIADAMATVSDNFHRLRNGLELRGEVRRDLGY